MRVSDSPTMTLRYRTALLVTAGVVGTALLVGCPVPTDGGNGTPGDGTTGQVTGEIVNVKTNFGVSALDLPISILYTVTGQPNAIAGYYVAVTDAGEDSAPIGDRVIIATGLLPGTNRAFSFDPEEAGVGFYRVGILLLVGATETVVESEGVIQVEGTPDPMFIQPPAAVTEVEQGEDVLISFDAGDPEGDVQWRLFYLRSSDPRTNPPDQLGTLISIGSGNVGLVTLATGNLPLGDYEIGIAATDSGSSVTATVASGSLDRIVTIPSVSRSGPIIRIVELGGGSTPTLTFSAPGSSDVELFKNEAYLVGFRATLNEPDATGELDLFYDSDNVATNGFRATLAENLALTTTSFALPTDLPEGTWFIGGTVRTTSGSSFTRTAYATGRIIIVRNPTLTITKPNSPLPVRPGGAVEIEWTTNAPASSGKVDVFAKAVSASSQPFGLEIPIVSDAAMTRRSATFTTDNSGVYQITVRLEFIDGTTKTTNAPQNVRISSLPPILWLGGLADDNPSFEGAIFGGVNFEDNAGTSLSPVNDLNGDGRGEFVVAARYGKPFFVNPTGIGPGEAYLVYGGSGATKLIGEYNLNSVGTSLLTGVTVAGVRTPQSSNLTDGMSSVSRIPDLDGDGKDELVFGVPNTDSRGHNVDPEQDGVVDPKSLSTLEREDQFLRGGIVFVSSRNSILNNPTSGTPSIFLDLAGQEFDSNCVGPEPDGFAEFAADQFAIDVLNPTSTPPCDGSCAMPSSGGALDANNTINYGFARALARDFFFSYVYSVDFFGGAFSCSSVAQFLPTDCLYLQYCRPFPAACEPFSPGLHAAIPASVSESGFPVWTRRSGFYTTTLDNADGTQSRNRPREPLGARVIGVGTGDRFGTSLTLTRATSAGAGDIIVSSPARTGRGILLGPFPAGCTDPPTCGGEVDGLEGAGGTAKTNSNSGVAYLFQLRSLWTDDQFGRIPPKPHQYIVGEASHCGGPLPLIPNVDAIRIAGQTDEQIRNIAGIDDFNKDGRNDFAVGAPSANGGRGRVYVAYRREPSVEGDYVLEKLALDPNSADRLSGTLIVTDSEDGLGTSLASGLDFNHDGLSDLVTGSPNAVGGVGEVVIVFGTPGITSGAGGITVSQLLTTSRTTDGGPVAARIAGNSLDPTGRFGFNIANAGDIDGDGLNDLLIAAPNASPRFDPDPTDDVDELTEPGIDANFDGFPDDVSGPLGQPDGAIDSFDELRNAGIVYVILGSNRLDEIPAADVTINIDELGGNQLRGFMVVGRFTGDRLGGGDGGDTSLGGIAQKVGRGRSYGLAGAGDVDGDGRDDFLIGSILADPRKDPNTGIGVQNGGEAYLIYGFAAR